LFGNTQEVPEGSARAEKKMRKSISIQAGKFKLPANQQISWFIADCGDPGHRGMVGRED
jgi:hypothetical protein